GREERLKDARQRRVIHTAAIIADDEPVIAARRDRTVDVVERAGELDRLESELDDAAAAIADRLRGVGAEVEQNLPELALIALDDRGRARDAAAQLDRRGQRRAQQTCRVAD